MEPLRKGRCSQTETALHTHDIIAYKRCRRKWGFTSPFKMHLKKKLAAAGGANQHLWFGSAYHWAMEDSHGERRFDSARDAFQAYVDAHPIEERPDNWEELQERGHAMLSYYMPWEEEHAVWKEVWHEGRPLVEEQFSLVLDELGFYELRGLNETEVFVYYKPGFYTNKATGEICSKEELIHLGAEYKEIVYHGTFDAIVEDKNGDWWVLDYKTVKAADVTKLSRDPQISAYCWAASQWYQREIQGMVYVQAVKSPPQPPKVTKSGISSAKTQRTTHAMYMQALKEYYGDVQSAPQKCLDFLNSLADTEEPNGNKFVRYDFVPRNYNYQVNTYKEIIATGREMINPLTPLLNNPTRDCSWDCQFTEVCLAMNEDADYNYLLQDFEIRPETMKDELPKWQKRMFRMYPERFPEEFDKYCKNTVDTIDEFADKMKEANPHG